MGRMVVRLLPILLCLLAFRPSCANPNPSDETRRANFETLHFGDLACAPGAPSDGTLACRVTEGSDYEVRIYDPDVVRANDTFQANEAAIEALLNAGPGTWIHLKEVRGTFGFIRGLTGYPDGGAFPAVQESLDLFLGTRNAWPKTVSLMDNPDEELVMEFARRVNAGYANPLTVKGRTDVFADVDYMDPVTQDDVDAIVASTTFEELDRHQCVPQLPVGASIALVSDVALLLPTGTCYIDWTLKLITFYEQFMRAGVALRPDSAGARFRGALLDILSKYPDIRPEDWYGGESQHDKKLQHELYEFFKTQKDFRGLPPGN